MSKKKKQSILLFLILLAAFAFILLISDSETKIEEMPDTSETKIEEIPNTQVFAVFIDKDLRYFVISNPPEDLKELQDLVAAYTKTYIKENDVSYLDKGNIDISYFWWFFRETSEINVNWKEDHGYFSVDRIEDHVSDVIAAVSWDRGDSSFLVWTAERSQEEENYGEYLNEEETWVDFF